MMLLKEEKITTDFTENSETRRNRREQSQIKRNCGYP
jgi:hypothetical protein